MCGIAGYIGTRQLTEGAVHLCLSLMGRRGPDGSGVFRHTSGTGRHTCLLHSRLSIIDLEERAAQPMRRGNHVLVFNGEVYNYLEVKSGLEAHGETFATSSDTEVLLAALAQNNCQALDSLEGMWAFALYDRESGILKLCRDRFGEKPLYLHSDATGIYFGSEVKFITALSGKKFAPNLTHIRRFLVNGYKSLYKQPSTFFEGIEELQPATMLTVTSEGKTSKETYWTPQFRPDESMTFDQAVAGARDKLIRSMEVRLRSDVPLAFCQSGGVDSASLLSIAKQIFDYDVHGFTVVSKDERYDEWDIVKETIDELGIRHTAIPVDTSNFLANLREVVRYHDAPVYTISYYAHWLLAKSVAEHGYKVSISGTAADELFTGYYDHHALYLAGVYESDLYEPSLANWNRHIKPIVRNPILQDPEVFVKNPSERAHIYLERAELNSRLAHPFTEDFFEAHYCDSPLRNRMLNELFNESVPVILHEDDLNAMYFSIENRSPFLDRGLFDFCYSIPTRHLISDGYNKVILREAMRGIAPDCVLHNRRKIGFNAPLFDFLDVAEPVVRQELLSDSPIFDVVRREVIESMLQPGHIPNNDSKFLFSFIGCKMFLEEFTA